MQKRAKAWLRDWVGRGLFLTGVTRPGRAARGKLLLATFHRVLPEAASAGYAFPGLAVSPEELDWLLGFFTRHYTCLPLLEAHTRLATGEVGERPLLAVTFDDGQRDNFVHARPVLARHGIRATFFAVAERLGPQVALWHDRVAYAVARAQQSAPAELLELTRPLLAAAAPGAVEPAQVARALKRRPSAEVPGWVERLEALTPPARLAPWDGMMSVDELRRLADEGHTIGAHSATHAILTECDDEALEREVAGARRTLEQALEREVTTFCYPNGDHDARVVAQVERAGYRLAVTTRWGLNDPLTPPLTLRRCDIQGATARSRSGRLSRSRLAWRLSGLHPGL